MKIGINFNSLEHCNLFIKFLIKYGYKTTFLHTSSKSIRIDTTKRQIIGWAISKYIKCKEYDVDEVINWNDNIGFNFSDYEISRDFIQLLLSIGIKNTDTAELTCKNIRIQNYQLESSATSNYFNNYLCTYAIDLNLKKEGKVNMMPTKEQILSAASKCPQAEEVLKELFPDVFPTDKSVIVNDKFNYFICVREGGEFHHKGFYLNMKYNWSIENDNGSQILVPWKKC